MRRVLTGLLSLALAAGAAAQTVDSAKLARMYYDKGLDLMRAESWDAASRSFEEAISHDNLMVLAHYNLGQCRMAQKRFVEASIAYRAAREAFERLGTVSQQERNEREQARRDEIDQLRDSLIRVHQLKNVDVEQMTIRLQERIRVLESMQYRDDRPMQLPAEIPMALGSAYFRQQKLEDAEREYRDAVRIDGKLGAAHNNLAVIYMLTGRFAEAREAMAAAEAAGFAVNPRFKEDLAAREAAARN